MNLNFKCKCYFASGNMKHRPSYMQFAEMKNMQMQLFNLQQEVTKVQAIGDDSQVGGAQPLCSADFPPDKMETLQPDVLIGSELQETHNMSHIAPSTLMRSATSTDSGPAPLVSSLTNYCWASPATGCALLRLLQFTIGPVSLTHPVYICESGAMPLLIGIDVLKCFDAFINIGELKVGVRKPLPFTPPSFPDSRCLAVGDSEHGGTACSLPSSKPSETPSDVFSQIEQFVDQADALTNDVERDKH
ncbi:uncharacterized protein [Nothobranchius furzeri]|uniref:uncharacterized protein n=1 Tax=Nothobranchius furzeri TaxID=105023 RepID=UPI003904B359